MFVIKTASGEPLLNTPEFNSLVLKAISVKTGVSVETLNKFFGDGYALIYDAMNDSYYTYIDDSWTKISVTYDEIFGMVEGKQVKDKGLKSIW